MIPVRQSTAFEVPVGPVLDADGVAVTDCVAADFKIKKTTGNFAALNGSATLTHVSAGVYDLVLTTSDLDTVGLATVAIDDTVNACASLHLQVIEEAVYDDLYAASAVGYPTAAENADAVWDEPFAGHNVADTFGSVLPHAPPGTAGSVTDVSHINGVAATSVTNILSHLGTTGASTAQTGDAYAIVNSGTHGNAALKTLIDTIDDLLDTEIAAILAAVDTEIGSLTTELAKVPKSDGTVSWNATALAAIRGEATDALNAYDPPTNAEMEARTLVAADYFVVGDYTTPPTVAAIADGVWDEATLGHTTSGTFGEQLKTDVDAILADTNELQTDLVDGGRIDLILDSILEDTGTTLPATLSTISGYLDTEVAAILAAVDTEIGSLQTSVSGLWTTAISESYRSDGAAPTPAQALCELLAHMGEVAISGTSKTTYKFDGTTQAAVYTLDSSSTPTTITRSA